MRNLLVLLSTLLLIGSCKANADEVIGCGGFIKSNTEINFKIIRVFLLHTFWS